MTRPLTIEFIEPSEIRMDSPYNLCQIKIGGDIKFELEKAEWQDKCAWNNDNTKVALIKWNLEKNEPGFHLVVIELSTGKISESSRIFGCLNSIAFEDDNHLRINKFLYTGKKTNDGELIGNIDEVIEI